MKIKKIPLKTTSGGANEAVLNRYANKKFYNFVELKVNAGNIAMETITIQIRNKEQLNALKAMLKAFKIPFKDEVKVLCDHEFVEKIKKSEENQNGSVFLKSKSEIEEYFNIP